MPKPKQRVWAREEDVLWFYPGDLGPGQRGGLRGLSVTIMHRFPVLVFYGRARRLTALSVSGHGRRQRGRGGCAGPPAREPIGGAGRRDGPLRAD
jgi:hypothetical protein